MKNGPRVHKGRAHPDTDIVNRVCPSIEVIFELKIAIFHSNGMTTLMPSNADDLVSRRTHADVV